MDEEINIPPRLVELAKELNRESKLPGDCKATVRARRVALACWVLGDDRLALDISDLLVDVQNPQPVIEYDDEDEEDWL